MPSHAGNLGAGNLGDPSPARLTSPAAGQGGHTPDAQRQTALRVPAGAERNRGDGVARARALSQRPTRGGGGQARGGHEQDEQQRGRAGGPSAEPQPASSAWQRGDAGARLDPAAEGQEPLTARRALRPLARHGAAVHPRAGHRPGRAGMSLPRGPDHESPRERVWAAVQTCPFLPGGGGRGSPPLPRPIP